MIWIRIISLAVMFISRIRFPKSKSIAVIIRKRYGNNTLKTLRKFEKVDFKLRKIKLDIEFLNNCLAKNVIPKFLQFRLASKNSRPKEYQKYQLIMLKDEIKHKETLFHSTEKQFFLQKKVVQDLLSVMDFAHICSIYLCGNDNRLNAVSQIHDKKLFNLLNDVTLDGHNPEKVIHNFSSYNITDSDKSLLVKGLNFSIPPSKLNYANYCLNFELLYRDIQKLGIEDKSKDDFVKSKLKEIALSSYYDYNNKNNKPDNLSNEEFSSLQNLAKNNDIIVQKSDKGNSVILIDRITYVERMLEILSDESKFVSLTPNYFVEGKELQYIEKHEQKIRVFF